MQGWGGRKIGEFNLSVHNNISLMMKNESEQSWDNRVFKCRNLYDFYQNLPINMVRCCTIINEFNFFVYKCKTEKKIHKKLINF